MDRVATRVFVCCMQSRAGALVCTEVCLLMLGSVAMEKQHAAAVAAAAAAASVCLCGPR